MATGPGSVEYIDGKWVVVPSHRAEDLDGPPPAPKKVAKAKPKTSTPPAGLTTKQQKEITTPETND